MQASKASLATRFNLGTRAQAPTLTRNAVGRPKEQKRLTTCCGHHDLMTMT